MKDQIIAALKLEAERLARCGAKRNARMVRSCIHIIEAIPS